MNLIKRFRKLGEKRVQEHEEKRFGQTVAVSNSHSAGERSYDHYAMTTEPLDHSCSSAISYEGKRPKSRLRPKGERYATAKPINTTKMACQTALDSSTASTQVGSIVTSTVSNPEIETSFIHQDEEGQEDDTSNMVSGEILLYEPHQQTQDLHSQIQVSCRDDIPRTSSVYTPFSLPVPNEVNQVHLYSSYPNIQARSSDARRDRQERRGRSHDPRDMQDPAILAAKKEALLAQARFFGSDNPDTIFAWRSIQKDSPDQQDSSWLEAATFATNQTTIRSGRQRQNSFVSPSA